MILVDTSIWIELIRGRLKRGVSADDLLAFFTRGPVVQEVLQGLRDTPASDGFREAFWVLPRLSDPLPLVTFLEAAEIYRHSRRRSYTVRSSTDCLTAAIAFGNKVPVWHKDRDFSTIARHTPLQAVRRL